MTQTEKAAEKILAFLRAQKARGAAYADFSPEDVGQLIGKRNHRLCADALALAAKRVPAGRIPGGRPEELRFHLGPCLKTRGV